MLSMNRSGGALAFAVKAVLGAAVAVAVVACEGGSSGGPTDVQVALDSASDASDASEGADVADAADAADSSDAADSTDITDGADATDATEGADGADGADITDASDAADVTDATDATDATEGADVTDGSDGSDTGWVGQGACCQSDADCAGELSDGPALVCAESGAGSCEPLPAPGQCWNHEDCQAFESCEGAKICPCNADCQPGGPGLCVAVIPGCCASDTDCADGDICLSGVCTQKPTGGACYSAADCSEGECTGAFVCPCGAPCFMPTTAGQCGVPANECTADGDCAQGETCVAGPVCTDLCVAGDPACCSGNVCSGDAAPPS